MDITKLNYEAFVIDYLEGNLSQTEKNIFDQFLTNHPEIKTEISDYLEAPSIEENRAVVYEKKHEHLKPETRNILLPIILFLGSALLISFFYNSDKLSKPSIDTIKQNEIRINAKQSPLQIAKASPTETSPIEKITLKSTSSQNKVVQSTNIITAKADRTIEPSTVNKTKALTSLVNNINLAQEPKTEPIAIIDTKTVSVMKSLIIKDKVQLLASLEPIETIDISTLTIDDNKIILAENFLSRINLAKQEENKVPQNSKKEKFWNLFTPQAYKDVDLKNSMASQGLKSASDETEMNIAPQNYFSK